MFLRLTHPSLEQLSRFAEAADDDRFRMRLAAHLERCQRCRNAVAFLRRLGGAVERLPAGDAPRGLRERILSDRTAGARAILPTADPVRVAHRPALRVAGVLLAIGVGVMLFARGPEAVAFGASGELVLRPAHPMRGATISVTYRPGGLLEGQRPLVLRARYRTAADEEYNSGIATHTVATLEGAGRTRDARFTLPDSVVYAVFAVEDTAARIIDDNSGRYWELLVTDGSGKPLFEALDQRGHDMMGRNWEEGFATAQQMIRDYPNRIEAWSRLRAFHGWTGTLDDSVAAFHRAKAREFAATFASRADLSDIELGYLAWYAYTAGDSTLAAEWRARLMREAPSNEFAVQWRLVEILKRLWSMGDTAAALDAFEALWPEAATRSAQVARYAGGIAWRTDNPALIRRWSERLIRHDRDPRATSRAVATRYTRLPALRAEGMTRLRNAVAALDTLRPEDRRLGETVEEALARQDAARRAALAALGPALLAEGRRGAGLDTLALAVERGWDLALFRDVAAARLEAEDTIGALGMHALVAADPRNGAAVIDSLMPLIRSSVGDAWWRDRLHQAQDAFRARMLARTKSRPVEMRARVEDARGASYELGDLLRGRTSLVVFWSRFCAPAVEALPLVDSIAAILTERGTQVLSIVEHKPSADLDAFMREQALSMPVYHDVRQEAGHAFNQWGTPAYYLVDAQGYVRFDYANPVDELIAQAEALRLEAVALGR